MTILNRFLALAVAATVGIGFVPDAAHAYEFGTIGSVQPSGVDLLDVGGSPPTGLYGSMSSSFSTRTVTGPGAPKIAGGESVTAVSVAPGVYWATPWTLFGARYSVVLIQPINYATVGAPANVKMLGMHNTYVAPINLSWALGDTGVFVKTFFSMFVPDGKRSGPAGVSSPGTPWWTLQPGVVISYLRNGWNLTLKTAVEMNTPNTYTGYKSGDVLHMNLVATKTFGRWTVGPVATYMGQISGDTSSAYYHGAINVNRYNDLAVGGMVSYNFGPATVHLWVTKDVIVNASGGTAGKTDSATFTKGTIAFMTLNFPIR